MTNDVATLDIVTVKKVCRECGNYFETAQAELDWLKEKGLHPYSRCKDCRQKLRKQREENERTNAEAEIQA